MLYYSAENPSPKQHQTHFRTESEVSDSCSTLAAGIELALLRSVLTGTLKHGESFNITYERVSIDRTMGPPYNLVSINTTRQCILT